MAEQRAHSRQVQPDAYPAAEGSRFDDRSRASRDPGRFREDDERRATAFDSNEPIPSDTSSAHVSLEAWLDVAWFYPEGFQRESIDQLEDGWLVRGNGFVYRFFQPSPENHDPRSRFARNWQLACEELLDNAPWAPELHYSLRLLRWNEDEPQWFSFKPDGDLDPLSPPDGIDDVALVMRRIPAERLLEGALSARTRLADHTVGLLADSLSSFHRQQRDSLSPIDRAPSERAWPLELIRVRHSDRLTKAFVATGSFLDPFSRAAFLEIQGYIASFLRTNSDLFPHRFAEGWITEIHGALTADKVLLPARRASAPVQLFGRADRGTGDRYGDVLEDLASISVELEAAGNRTTARDLERAYSTALRPAVSLPLLRFYKASAALRKAVSFADGSSKQRAADDPTRSVQLLSLGLRYALGLTRPFLMVMDGAQKPSGNLAHAIEALVPVTIVEEESLDAMLPITLPRELRFERMMMRIRRMLTTGTSLIVRWPLNRDEERRAFLQLAESMKNPVLFVRHDDPEEIAFRPQSSWPPPPHVPAISVYPIVDLPQLALHVLRCLVGHKMNRDRLAKGL